MKSAAIAAATALFCTAAALPAQARTLCTVVADAADGRVLVKDGDCDTPVTPASTFKIALAVMGFESGLLKNAHDPLLPFRPGYTDWAGAVWREPTDPQRWLKYSVVWYSQLLARELGTARLTDYARSFDYGNADFSGDAGKDNGLERAWIGSSLKIAPAGQIAFLEKLVNLRLPVKREAMEKTIAIVETAATAPGGWQVRGKTGMAYPRNADGSFDEAHAWGWYVGWAQKDGRTLVFARLDQDTEKQDTPTGNRARAAFLEAFPATIAD